MNWYEMFFVEKNFLFFLLSWLSECRLHAEFACFHLCYVFCTTGCLTTSKHNISIRILNYWRSHQMRFQLKTYLQWLWPKKSALTLSTFVFVKPKLFLFHMLVCRLQTLTFITKFQVMFSVWRLFHKHPIFLDRIH